MQGMESDAGQAYSIDRKGVLMFATLDLRSVADTELAAIADFFFFQRLCTQPGSASYSFLERCEKVFQAEHRYREEGNPGRMVSLDIDTTEWDTSGLLSVREGLCRAHDDHNRTSFLGRVLADFARSVDQECASRGLVDRRAGRRKGSPLAAGGNAAYWGVRITV